MSKGTSGMIVGEVYVVTRGSRDGEFRVGDRVSLLEDGCIFNYVARGWMPAEDVIEATRDWQIKRLEVDRFGRSPG